MAITKRLAIDGGTPVRSTPLSQAGAQLRALLEAGIDQITTDTALQLSALLSAGRASS